eukprot:419995_1
MSAIEKAKKYGMIAFLIFLVLVLVGLVSLAGYLGYNLYRQSKTKNVSEVVPKSDEKIVVQVQPPVVNKPSVVTNNPDQTGTGVDSQVSTIAPMYDFVSTPESISADITTYAEKARAENKLFFVVVCGTHGKKDKSWCPDCRKG